MPKDYPDWFGQPQYPKWGTPTYVRVQESIMASAQEILLEQYGKGQLIGGHIYTYNDSGSQEDSVYITIDDTYFAFDNIRTLFERNITKPNLTPIYIVEYNTTQPRFCIGLSPGIIFDKKLIIYYKNNGAYGVYVEGQFMYYLIE